jgi:hypothetical protein
VGPMVMLTMTGEAAEPSRRHTASRPSSTVLMGDWTTAPARHLLPSGTGQELRMTTDCDETFSWAS